MLKLHLRDPTKSTQRHGQILGSNAAYFDSDNFQNLDFIVRREEEKQRQVTSLQVPEEPPKVTFEEKPIEEQGVKEIDPKHRVNQKPFYGLRRPLDDGARIEIEPGDIDLEQWADKPYSTVACHDQLLGYQDIFPLHMQKVTETEEKEHIQIQTETRRHSIVTTDYFHGRITLENSQDGHNAHFDVFPKLHAILSSSSETSDDEEEEIESQTFSHSLDSQSTVNNSLNTLNNSLDTKSTFNNSFDTKSNQSFSHNSSLHKSHKPSIEKLPVEFPSGYNIQRRRTSTAGRHAGPSQPRVVRRRSLDCSGISTAFVQALEAASMAMKVIEEHHDEGEEEDHETSHLKTSPNSEAARAVFDSKYAEETMDNLEGNLRTLETFLESSKSSDSTAVNSDEEGDNEESITKRHASTRF